MPCHYLLLQRLRDGGPNDGQMPTEHVDGGTSCIAALDGVAVALSFSTMAPWQRSFATPSFCILFYNATLPVCALRCRSLFGWRFNVIVK